MNIASNDAGKRMSIETTMTAQTNSEQNTKKNKRTKSKRTKTWFFIVLGAQLGGLALHQVLSCTVEMKKRIRLVAR